MARALCKDIYLKDFWERFLDYFLEIREKEYPKVYAESKARLELFKYYRGIPSKKVTK